MAVVASASLLAVEKIPIDLTNSSLSATPCATGPFVLQPTGYLRLLVIIFPPFLPEPNPDPVEDGAVRLGGIRPTPLQTGHFFVRAMAAFVVDVVPVTVTALS